jgi:hypothetical protein
MSTVIPTIATVVGSSVSSAVYSSVITTGDLGAATISKSINYAGKGLGYGADLLGATRVATTVRALGEAGEIISAPAIRTGSKTLAFGASIAAGTVAGLLTAGVAHGSIWLYNYGIATYEKYKEPVYQAIQGASTVATEAVLAKIQQPTVATYDEITEVDAAGNVGTNKI